MNPRTHRFGEADRNHGRANPSAAVLQTQKATILYAERVTRGATLEELRKFYHEGQIVELTLVIGAANFTNRFNDALRNIPDVGV